MHQFSATAEDIYLVSSVSNFHVFGLKELVISNAIIVVGPSI